MKMMLSLLLIVLPSVSFAAEKQISLNSPNSPSTTQRIIFNPLSKEPKDEGNTVPTPTELKKQYLNRINEKIKERFSEKVYFGLATVGHTGVQTFNYFNSEAKASIEFYDTRLTLRAGQDKPVKFEIRRDFKLDNNSRFESGSFTGYISQKGSIHVGFRFKF